ncbi:hypothetical protein DFH08DRAFT_820429 [Mycena albidolilacea]|uniref:Uncharacterized protein n=1 Tax=Mycena albidolilacea TaxID=1033008 RepID=A0AAD6ZCM3_9AGAR|nr:hypothetical protein DFH08DRAFT_820429 [Mycena albidolilacea]
MYAPSRGSHPKYEDVCAARTLRCGCTGAAGTRMGNRGDVETVSLWRGLDGRKGMHHMTKDIARCQFPDGRSWIGGKACMSQKPRLGMVLQIGGAGAKEKKRRYQQGSGETAQAQHGPGAIGGVEARIENKRKTSDVGDPTEVRMQRNPNRCDVSLWNQEAERNSNRKTEGSAHEAFQARLRGRPWRLGIRHAAMTMDQAYQTRRKDGHRFIYISVCGRRGMQHEQRKISHWCSSKRCDSGSWRRSGPRTEGIDERRGESPYEVDVQEQVRNVQRTARGDSGKVKASALNKRDIGSMAQGRRDRLDEPIWDSCIDVAKADSIQRGVQELQRDARPEAERPKKSGRRWWQKPRRTRIKLGSNGRMLADGASSPHRLRGGIARAGISNEEPE